MSEQSDFVNLIGKKFSLMKIKKILCFFLQGFRLIKYALLLMVCFEILENGIKKFLFH